MMKKLLFLFVSLFTTFNSFAQGVVQDREKIKELTKANTETINSIKKANGYKKVTIELIENNDWHFLVKGGKGYGIVSKDGKLIIEPRFDWIKFKPKLEAGYSPYNIPYRNHDELLIYHSERAAHYVGGNYNKKHKYGEKRNGVRLSYQYITILDEKGQVLKDSIDYELTEIPGYYCVGVFEGLEFSYNDKNSIYFPEIQGGLNFGSPAGFSPARIVGLYTTLGETILEPIYNHIVIGKDICMFQKEEGKINKKGGFLLNEPSKMVPPIFNECSYKDGNWIVRRNSNDKKEVFVPTQTSTGLNAFRDDGERYYEQNKYDDVIKFYSNKGVDAPWAKFFTAKALEKKAFAMDYAASSFVTCVNNNIIVNEIPYVDWSLMRKQYETAKTLYNAYLDKDSTYKELAKNGASLCDYLIMELDNGKPQKEFKEAYDIFQKKQAEEAARLQREQQIREQQAAAMSSLITSFMGKIMNSYGSSSSGATRSSSFYNNQATGQGSTTTNSSSSSSEQNTTTRKTCPRCNGKGRIEVEQTVNGGLQKRMKTCSECGKNYDSASIGHHHENCSSCRGRGYYEIK